MRTLFGFLASLAVLGTTVHAVQPDDTNSDRPGFSAPVRLKAADQFISTESPGFAAPCWHDFDQDGHKDLIVGQFAGGKMKIYRNLGDGKLAAGEWLMVDDAPALVPGVW